MGIQNPRLLYKEKQIYRNLLTWEIAELKNSKCPDNAPGEFRGCKAGGKLLRDKGIGRGLAELE